MLYICYQNILSSNFIGVRKKILAQCKVFHENFGKTYYTVYTGQFIYILSEENIIEKELAVSKKQCNEVLVKWIIKYKIKRVYIRYNMSDLWFVNFFIKLKELGVKSVLEFQTYPYDNEGGIRKPTEDHYYREQLHKYIDCCTTYADYKIVFDIPCIPLVNGINPDDHKLKKKRKMEGMIVLLAVASLARWHGYERIIMGMHSYYTNGGRQDIVFNIVGEGGQLQYYKRIVDEYKLKENVIFHGQLTGQKLDDIYDASDLAVGSLGFYKTGLETAAPIKLREYCARGIPFIYGYHDISFDESNYFAYRVSNDSEPVDMNGVIDFYEKMYDGRDFVSDMRQYTMEHLTWDNILKPVIDYLQ